MDPSGNDGLLPAISGRREDFPQPAVRCGTDGLRAGVVNPPGLTCAALPLTSEGRSASSGERTPAPPTFSTCV
ncbi:transcriptional regulator (plasmid) [Escherichia fergusonii]|nr:transcriptional regulator [Escherichia fergusonii]